LSNEAKFNRLVERKDYIRCDSGLGGGMLWVLVEDQRNGEIVGEVCTDPESRYHREGDLPLTPEGVEEMFARLCFELGFGV